MRHGLHGLALIGLVIGLAAGFARPAQGQTNADGTATVVFALKTCTGNAQSRALLITALGEPEDYWAEIWWGTPITVFPTNGVVSVHLVPDDYAVEMVGAPGTMNMTVTSNGTYSALSLSTNVPGYRSAASGPATVQFPLRTMTGGMQTRAVTMTALVMPFANGTNIVWGAAVSATPTNGLASTPLEPQGYRVELDQVGGAMVIYVPTDGGTYNASLLPDTMPSNVPTNVIPAGAVYAPPSPGPGYYRYACAAFTNSLLVAGSRYVLTLGNATYLTNLVSHSVYTSNVTFTAEMGLYFAFGPYESSPTGPYFPPAITTTIIGPQ